MDRFENFLFDESFRNNLWKRCFKLTLNEDDAQDLIQDCFVKALDKKETFLRATRIKENFESLDVERWVYTLCRNMFFDKTRKKTEGLVGDELPDLVSEGDQQMEMAKKDLRYCLETLNQDEREIISLVQQSSYAEISDILSISSGNVRVKAHRAREKLSDCMGLAA